MDRKAKIEYIAARYGYGKQSRICIEEMAELTKAICKYDRATTLNERIEALKNVQEELADVEIMVRQLKHLLGETEVEEQIDYKLNRQLERIERESTC